MTMLTGRMRQRTHWDWRLKLYPLIVIPAMVYLNVAPQEQQATDSPSSRGEVPASATPINAAPRVGDRPDNTPEAASPAGGRIQSSVAAPVQGIDGKGRHYLIERSPKWPMIEFRMRLKQPNTIVDRTVRGGM